MHWILRVWLPIAIAVTGMSIVIFAAIQQYERQSLNDPQIQQTEDAAAILSNGGTTTDVISQTRVIDAAASLAPWIALYDASGTPIASDAIIAGKAPVLPEDFFTAARSRGMNLSHDSWENADGTHIALVLRWIPEKHIFVAGGRNMREVENREWQLEILVAIGWIATLAATLVASWFGGWMTVQPGELW